MGYTDVHYAAKDSMSAVGALVMIMFWVTAGVLILIISVVIVVWGIVKLVQLVRARSAARSDRAHLTTDADTVPIGIANPEALPSAASGPRHEGYYYLADDGDWYWRQP